ncbi:MAG TPA: DNA-binding response regulator [Firmicutes bacterium]|nr:response regulator transcription factor [Bacillota bacterium]HAA37514.1 DNA-binding response regulator [Bacillota bacterium]
MRVVIVDDDSLVVASLATILAADGEIEVAGTGNSGQEAVELYRTVNPDVLLLDIRMDGMTGIEAAEIILAGDQEARILFLTTFSDNEYIVKALQIGAKGYILKQDYESIVPSLKAVYMGQRVFGEAIMSKIPLSLNKFNEQPGLADYNLNEKEVQIITLVANGLSNKEIAGRLFLSEGTVRNYISVILEKLQLRDRTQLAIFYYQHSQEMRR